MDGVSLAGVLRSDHRAAAVSTESRPRWVASQWHTEWGFTVEPGRKITDGRYAYITYAEGGDEEFYDLSTDPYETRNLVADPTAADALNRAREAFDRYLADSDDPFRNLQAVAAPRWRSHGGGYAGHRSMAAPQAPRE
jgi:hypothetical protein